MQLRYHIQNKKYMIEFPHNNDGYKDAISFRKLNTKFKGRHIKSVLQAYPSKIICGILYPLTYSYNYDAL